MTTDITSKVQRSLERTLAKPAIKAHARATPQKLSIKLEQITVTVDGDACSLSIGSNTVSFTLTKHYKSGNYYVHWIRLNKALIQLDISTQEVEGSSSSITTTPSSTIPNSALKHELSPLAKGVMGRFTSKYNSTK
ncbi:hypothetical protein AB4259_02755 [Vibrio amylolyticus]|uniref:hypothetical protein n=1 Tax=Vibrio amylolyticus TaxID=2847292 RepID=UPI00354C2B24